MRHFLVGAILLMLALATTFAIASILQGYHAATRPQPAPVAGTPSASKPGDPAGRSPTVHRVNFQR